MSGVIWGMLMEAIAGMAENNGSLLPGLWRDSLHVTCGLTACTPGSAPAQRSVSEYGTTINPTGRIVPGIRGRGMRCSDKR